MGVASGAVARATDAAGRGVVMANWATSRAPIRRRAVAKLYKAVSLINIEVCIRDSAHIGMDFIGNFFSHRINYSNYRNFFVDQFHHFSQSMCGCRITGNYNCFAVIFQ